MKFFLLFALIFPTLSWAYPALGDFVHYEAKFEDAYVKLEKTVLSHDLVANTFEVRTFMTFKGNVLQNDIHVLPYSFLYTPEKVASVIKNCEAREGMITELVVQSIPMSVCEFYNEESQLTNMIGPVPFGVVRFQVYLQGEDFLDFNLTSFN